MCKDATEDVECDLIIIKYPRGVVWECTGEGDADSKHLERKHHQACANICAWCLIIAVCC